MFSYLKRAKDDPLTCLFLAAFLFLFVGCVALGRQEIEQGQLYEANGQWDEAVRSYEEALRMSPGNFEYENALQAVKRKAAQAHYSQARSLMEKAKPTLEDVEAAIGKMEEARKYNSADESLNSYYQELAGRREKLKSEIDKLYQEGSASLDQKKWEDALQKLDNVLDLQPKHKEARGKQGLARNNYLADLYLKGHAFLRTEEWEKAIESFSKIAALIPDYGDTKDRLLEAKSKNNAAYQVIRGNEALAQKDWETAIKYFAKALEYSPSDQRIREELDQARDSAAESHYQKATSYAHNSQWRKALEEFQQVAGIIPQYKDVNIQMETVRTEWVNQLYLQAQTYEKQELWGNAYVRYKEAGKYLPGFKDASNRVERLKEKIKQRTTLSMTVLPFESPSESKDAGPLISQGLASYLFAQMDRDVKVVEKESGGVTSVDILVVGKVLQYKAEHSDSEGSKTVQVQVGAKKVPNPVYETWLRLSQDKTRRNLPPPSETIEEPIYQSESYKVGTYRVTVFLNISFRVIEIEDEKTLLADTHKVEEMAEDNYVEGLEKAGIKHDPKTLLTDTELLNRATDKVIHNKMGPSILSLFKDRDATFLKQGNQYKTQGQYEQAIEAYANCMINAEIKGLNPRTSSQPAQESIEEILRAQKM